MRQLLRLVFLGILVLTGVTSCAYNAIGEQATGARQTWTACLVQPDAQADCSALRPGLAVPTSQ